MYFYGDPVNGGNKLLDSTADSLEGDDVKYYVDGNGLPTTVKPAKPITEEAEGVDGRILTAAKAGDSSDWVEIATNGDYSLIVRRNFIRPNNNMDKEVDLENWNADPANAQYKSSESHIRNSINNWFEGNASVKQQLLDPNANIRNYTVRNNAVKNLGTAVAIGSISTGISKPEAVKTQKGDDVAFALSYGEAANYCSNSRFERGPGGNIASGDIARANFGKIIFPGELFGFWLRSNGEESNSTGYLENEGRASETYVNDRGLVYPALWVDSAIFTD
jgi:hypothetical protein